MLLLNELTEIAIIGGGAAGLATAIFAARKCRRHGVERSIVVFDGAKRLGAKILISGGGRCNVTNDVVTADDFSGGSRNVIRRVLAAFSADRTVEFFREIGVPLHVEPGGKLFPDSNRARTVLDALIGEAERLGVEIRTNHRVTAIARVEGDAIGFEISMPHGTIAARSVVLATGGLSVPKTGSDGTGYQLAEALGHSILPRMPALVPLVLDREFHQPLSGVSHEAAVILHVEGSKPLRLGGSLLWTHFGVSGPVVLDASRHWHAARGAGHEVTVSISFLPGDDFESAERKFLELAVSQPRQSLLTALAQLVPARVADAVLDQLQLNRATPLGQLPREARRLLVQALLDWPLAVRDSRGFQYAEVTAGGVPLDEVDTGTLESRRSPGLYLVGEILDVDGRIGGFNFQWAWSSAWVAAEALARALH